jgi:hypothetical protein
LQRTYSIADLAADASASEAESMNIDVVFPGEDTDQGAVTDPGEPETDVETPKKKKKTSVQESINEHAAQLAVADTGSSKEKRTSTGKNNKTSASGAKGGSNQARASGKHGPVT